MDRSQPPQKAEQYGVKLPGEGEKMFSPNDVAKMTGVTSAAVCYWIRQYQLPAVKQPNGNWLIRAPELERFLKRRVSGEQRRVAFVEAPAQIKQHVEQLGFDVIQATNVTDAVLKVASSRPRLFVLDASSRCVPALTLLEHATRQKLTRGARILMIGTIADSDITRALNLGVRGIARSVSDAAAELERLVGQG